MVELTRWLKVCADDLKGPKSIRGTKEQYTDCLQTYQKRALEYVAQQAAGRSQHIQLEATLAHAKVSRDIYDQAKLALSSYGQIAVHFHPERLSRLGVCVAEGLLQSGCYKNQFETGISNGSPSAFAGGERDLWERYLFGGAYHEPEVMPASRPKYGALQIIPHTDGPAPRFGSCYFYCMRTCAKGRRLLSAVARKGIRLHTLEPSTSWTR